MLQHAQVSNYMTDETVSLRDYWRHNMFINSVQLIRNGFIHDKPISLRPRVMVVCNNENIGTSKHRGASGFVSNALIITAWRKNVHRRETFTVFQEPWHITNVYLFSNTVVLIAKGQPISWRTASAYTVLSNLPLTLSRVKATTQDIYGKGESCNLTRRPAFLSLSTRTSQS